MRYISTAGLIIGLAIAFASYWRWAIFYIDDFRMLVGMIVAMSFIIGSWIFEVLDLQVQKLENLEHRLDSLVHERGRD